MRFDVLTIFPDWFDGPLGTSLLGRAIADGTVTMNLHDLRQFALDKHRSVDDSPYGGGAGMVMRADVLLDACEHVWNDGADGPYTAGGQRPRTVVLTPRGRPFTQADARAFAAEPRLTLICGRYEGIDERVHDLAATDEISIGDYVVFGGEVAAAVVIEAVVRLLPGVVGNAESPNDESFSDGLLEYPQYTRPETVRGMAVPDVLRSGDHGAVDRWRKEQQAALTKQRRPDL
ncbi:MAG: tRNA (guanosine(37)-N1)-methyltransferase TrmD [Nitriliruptoraceae bacterium]